jgi:hypothetical protein
MPPIMPELGVRAEDDRFGGWRRLRRDRWAPEKAVSVDVV